MTRIVTFTEFGAPEVLKIEDVEVAEPAANEIRIRVKAIGLNRADSMWRTDSYVEPVKLPGRLGYEVAGIVDAVGADVTHLSVGDEVTTMPAFSLNDYGMYGDLVLAPAYAAVKKSADMSFEEAAAIWATYITPWGAFIENGLVTEHDTVVITAASSGVGMAAIQVAKLAGATVIALSRTSAKKTQLLAAGADHVVATEEQDLVEKVNHLTEGKGATVVFDPVGGPSFPKLVDATAPGGTIFVYGALSDAVTPLPMIRVLAKELTIRGFNLFGITTSAERQAKVVQFVYDNVAAGKIKITLGGTFKLNDIVEAHRVLEKNEHTGKLIVTP